MISVLGAWARAALLVGLVSGCSGGRSTVMVNCGPNDNTVSCCVKKNVGNPEMCGLSKADATLIVAMLKGVESAVPEEEPDEDDPNEGWRDQCINLYVACKQRGWSGKCDDCLRWCQGQKQWPFHKCTSREQ
ncbi:hypothetical protein JY651_10735 [Pyxidicoccus parkwayensis]|uniref:Lipoprotein n=1 Tax=Pyxidicoccus parkwayensis TaxID=2813578 RepID=A0ABX7P4F9_9BACT|nr:hypothetical protein [Pyxidicoccus parkwaysis]QSQ25364.1 hypothetical protein JY651_10735 [Pyxidicoccus parkwaysis]